jgi:ParB/RepB/Spo0J family partition protein
MPRPPAKFQLIPLSSILVDRESRQRREIDTKGLRESIAKLGVLQPIIVQQQAEGVFALIAGERRLQACIELHAEGKHIDCIPARLFDELSEIERQIIELEENIKRQDLEWLDLVRSMGRIHALYCALDPGWTQGETADAISVSSGIVSMYLKVFGYIEDPRVLAAGTVREAYNLLDRRGQRAAGDALQEILETTNEVMPLQAPAVSEVVGAIASEVLAGAGGGALPKHGLVVLPPRHDDPAQAILCESFLQWAPHYAGKKFNILHCDFPYGTEVFSGPQMSGSHDTYNDSFGLYVELLDCLCTNLDRLMSVSGHLVFWFSDKHRRYTEDTFRAKAPSIEFVPSALIWTKSDNAGVASDSQRFPRHTYETALFGIRGGRKLVRVAADVYGAPTDKRWHVSTKPEPVLKHFLSMIVDENTRLLDPTCGSGSSLRAAEELGAASVLGMDIDERTVGLARTALRNSRMLRNASREIG